MIRIDSLLTKLEMALMVAEKEHANQTYDIFSYMYHIRLVVKISQMLGYDETIQVACALHDVMEDGSLSYNDIKNYFGEEVAEIVFAVTDELGRNRKERKSKTYPKIRKHWKAVAVKLCDRIANMTHSATYSPKMISMYRKEHEAFKEALTNPDHPQEELAKAWSEIDKIMESV
jgi:(p)ppGpp synthase/HD superfamily hydrolase